MAGIGVDIVEVERIGAIMTRTPHFVERVFTEEERAYASRHHNPAATYAGFFAAREAVLKALGTGFGAGIDFADVSVGHDSKGRPNAILAGGALEAARAQGVGEVYVSISHTGGVAVANAMTVDAQSQVKKADGQQDEKARIAAQFKQARSILDGLDEQVEE